MCAVDLDGTVLHRDLTITGATLRAIEGLRGRGVRVVVATGRRFEGASEQARRLGSGDGDPLVCYGGSMVRRLSGETLLSHRVPHAESVEFLSWAHERGLHARIFLDGLVVAASEPPEALDHLRSTESRTQVEVVDSPAEWLQDSGEEPLKIVIVDHPEEVGKWLVEAQAEFSGRLFVTRSLPHYVEVGSREGSKARALKFLCSHFGVDPARTAAFGDADNDIDVLRLAGVGVVVGGMTGEVRRAADIVVPPIEEDGFARYVGELLGKA